MKRTVLMLLLLAVGLSSFGMAKKKKKSAQAVGSISSVMIRRTVCFGRCPEYTIEISADGMATYTGLRFSPDTGIFKKSIGKAAAREITDMCLTYRVDTCKDVYENRIPDIPGLIVTVNYGKKKKEIKNAGFGPEFLKEIAGRMDELAKKTPENGGWKKVGMPVIK